MTDEESPAERSTSRVATFVVLGIAAVVAVPLLCCGTCFLFREGLPDTDYVWGSYGQGYVNRQGDRIVSVHLSRKQDFDLTNPPIVVIEERELDLRQVSAEELAAAASELDPETSIERLDDSSVEIRSEILKAEYKSGTFFRYLESKDPRVGIRARGEYIRPGDDWDAMIERLGPPDSVSSGGRGV